MSVVYEFMCARSHPRRSRKCVLLWRGVSSCPKVRKCVRHQKKVEVIPWLRPQNSNRSSSPPSHGIGARIIDNREWRSLPEDVRDQRQLSFKVVHISVEMRKQTFQVEHVYVFGLASLALANWYRPTTRIQETSLSRSAWTERSCTNEFSCPCMTTLGWQVVALCCCGSKFGSSSGRLWL